MLRFDRARLTLPAPDPAQGERPARGMSKPLWVAQYRAYSAPGSGSTGSSGRPARRQELEQQRLWDIRIYEDRERSLTYICEQPVLLEQRVFALAREIMGHLE